MLNGTTQSFYNDYLKIDVVVTPNPRASSTQSEPDQARSPRLCSARSLGSPKIERGDQSLPVDRQLSARA